MTAVDVATIASSLTKLDLITLRSAERIDLQLDQLAKIVPLNGPELRLRQIAADMRALVGGGEL